MVKALAMTQTDNSSFLAQANAQRHQAALSAAHHAIEQLQRQGKPVNFSAIAQSAGVSRGWLYRQDQLRDIIGRLRRLDQSRRVIYAITSHSHNMPFILELLDDGGFHLRQDFSFKTINA